MFWVCVVGAVLNLGILILALATGNEPQVWSACFWAAIFSLMGTMHYIADARRKP
jgi:hypothetical protein